MLPTHPPSSHCSTLAPSMSMFKMRSYLLPILTMLFVLHVFILDGSNFSPHLHKRGADLLATNTTTEQHLQPVQIDVQEQSESQSEAVPEIEHDQQHAQAAPAESDEEPACLKYILYDKPIKTGSTAITRGIRSFLDKRGETDIPCSNPVCSQKADEICKGTRPPEHLLSHITLPDDTFYCLKNQGFYTVTSIRDPKDRWRSSYYYNLKRNATHYGIPATASYSDFLAKYPACALLHYYDGKGSMCAIGGEEHEFTLQRIERIVQRFDEIIDLDEEPNGPMHREIEGYIREVNVAGKAEKDNQEIENLERLTYEFRLYEALREKRKLGPSGRRLCSGGASE